MQSITQQNNLLYGDVQITDSTSDLHKDTMFDVQKLRANNDLRKEGVPNM